MLKVYKVEGRKAGGMNYELRMRNEAVGNS
jgi:hypothetical protein